MDFNAIWQSILIFFIGTLILRIGGRKSISQMTISQTIVMIGLGSLLIQPISGKGLIVTFIVAFILVVLMMIIEFLALKIDFLENLFTGKAVIVVENGKANIKNLKKIRMSIDKLETRLRQVGISSIADVKYATIEVSGQLGYELMDNKKPLTKEEFLSILGEFSKANGNNIFKEINTKNFEGNTNEP